MEHSTRSLFITIVITSMLLGFGNSDLAQDREECTNQLIELSTCIPYVGGDAKAPTKDCCAGFGQVIRKSEKCVCILVRDKDDPQLGIKINASLAAHLPTACHVTAPNITDCISILHLPRNSTLAKEFESLGRIEENYNSTSPSNIHKDGTGGGKAEPVKSNGGKKKSWLGVELLIFASFSHLLLITSSI
ncbi:Bifunctional inhibitor/plant lipid transfer protein/seed storage helical domain superfamily [Arabidopsis suecica]|uniref:Bifunctional inhibitor/plant lipid transfer protein/seed storage helical domain superfamily n=1 Tax=Arabidopsis suecica TaxID=45249 RepID=A0A8T2D0W0_ARASU|nr:Bifunctional inhibitor/plant lipid transfer protein/seed storage helical domain superfamily [Arabidopsis suecica]